MKELINVGKEVMRLLDDRTIETDNGDLIFEIALLKSSISDAIAKRVVELNKLEQLGEVKG